MRRITVKKENKLRLFIFMLLLICLSVRANSTIRFYNADQLSSNLINSICQDGQGYMWISTKYGLNKFDGVRFTHYFHYDDTISIASDNVSKLFVDKEGMLWALSYNAVQQYNAEKDIFEYVHFKGEFSDFRDILQKPDGHLLVLSKHSLFEIDKNTMTAIPLSNVNKYLPDDNAKYIYWDCKDRLWMCGDHQVSMYDWNRKDGHIYEEELVQYGIVAGINEDAHQRLVVVTNNAVLGLDNQTGRFVLEMSIPGTFEVYRVYKNSKEELVMGSFGRGAYKLDFEMNEVHSVYHWEYKGISYDRQKVYAFYEDKGGNVWLGCYQAGLVFLSSKDESFHYFDLERTSFGNDRLLCTAFADKQGRLYVGQERNGLNIVDTVGNREEHLLPGITVTSVYDDTKGYFWIGTHNNGFCRLDTQTKQLTWIEKQGWVTDMTTDKLGNIYVAFFNDSIYSYDKSFRKRVLCNGQMKLNNRYVNVLYTDTEGLIWIGHYYGIDVYDPKDNREVRIPVDARLRKMVVHAIIESADGLIWIGCNKGLFAYDRRQHTWRCYTTRDGLCDDYVCGIVEDDTHHLWISTYHGLARMNTETESFVNFYQGNGLRKNQYMRSIYGYLKYGIVYFGNDKGLTYFAPHQILRNEFLQGITLTGVSLNGEPQQLSDELFFDYYSSFTLSFSSLDFREMENVYYEYRFTDDPQGFWHRMPASMSDIHFIHLSSGTHELEVRACDSGVYSAVKKMIIHITPPWYRSWWAYTLYMLFTLGVVTILILYYKSKKLAKMNEDKIRTFVDISHEFRSPLTLIKSPLEQLLQHNYDSQTNRALRYIARNTDRLLALVNQILSIRKIEKGQLKLAYVETNLTVFLSDLCHVFDYETEKRHIELSFSSSDEQLSAWIDPDSFDKVMSNLIGNALKFVEDHGKITMELKRYGGKILITVTDDGPGINKKQLKQIFERFYQTSETTSAGQMGYGIGLNLAYKIVHLHGGTIEADNRRDTHGAVFTVSLPMGNSHLPKEQLVDDGNVNMPMVETNVSISDIIGEKSHRVRKKTNYRIFVVDDDKEICQFLMSELGLIYHVRTYTNGQLALEAISDEVPDLVVSDVVMPVMDGYQLLHRIKNNTKTSHIPVVLLTTKNDHQSRIEGFEQGADAYIDKPFNLEELEVRIAGLIANHNRMKGKFSGLQEQEGTVRKIELKGNNALLMEKIMKVVNERLGDSEFNVDALADIIGMSRVQLFRRVKEITGITVGEFIRNLRMQQAAELLTKGDITVSQVAYAIGMANPPHFTAAFKKYFGVSPSEYMKKHSKKTE